jgi:hypothetical protein
MIYSLKLSRFRRANIWLDEPPPAAFRPSSERVCVLKSKVKMRTLRNIAAVEISVAHGPMTSYALIGAELVDTKIEDLQVIVPFNSTGSPFTTSLASKGDEVRLGLLDEYVDSVFTGVKTFASSAGLPTHMAMRFAWAAHASIGSSRSIFETATGLLLNLLMMPHDVSRDEIEAFLEQRS